MTNKEIEAFNKTFGIETVFYYDDKSICGYEENNAINMSGKLGGMDKSLSQALVSVSSSYKDAFDIMNAAKDNDDSEIQQYAYNDFSNKISSANNYTTPDASFP